MEFYKTGFAIACCCLSGFTANAITYGMIWNQSPPQYASVGDTFEVSATYYGYPSGVDQATFCISDPNFANGFDPNGAHISWGTVRTVNGKLYQPITVTSAGNGSLCICALAGSDLDYARVAVRSSSTTLSSINVNGSSSVISGNSTQLSITALSNSGTTITGGSETWSVSPSSYASISQSGLLSAAATADPRAVTVSTSYTYLGITKSNTKTINIIPICAMPSITPVDGTVFNAASQKITITTTTLESLIYFTTNGLAPTTNDNLYSKPFNIFGSLIIKAITVKSGYENSAIATSSITKFRETVVNPSIGCVPVSGTKDKVGHQLVNMSCVTENATIYYTLDNSIPNRASLLYNSPLEVFRTTNIKAIAVKSECIDSEITSLTVSNVVSLADALNQPDLHIESTGWMTTTNITHDGSYATFSGTTADNKTNSISTTIVGSGILSFWWKVSCEDDDFADNWDYLTFQVDGLEKARIDGVTPWRQISVFLAQGEHALRWEYRKDESSFAGDDCGWLDQLTWAPIEECTTTNAPMPVPYVWLDKFGLVANNEYEAAAKARCANGYLAWESYLAGLTPTNPASTFTSRISVSNGVPYISWIPDLGAVRKYSVWGKTNLTDSLWMSPTNAANRFFKVTVELE